VNLDGLSEFALRPWGMERAGGLIDRTPERLVELQPNFPIPGPNHVCLVRTAAERVPALLEDCRRLYRARGLPCAWIVGPGTEPADLGERLLALGLKAMEELEAMTLAADVELDPPGPGITFVDGLRDFETFRLAHEIQAEAFGGAVVPGLEARWAELEPGQDRRLVIACLDAEPAAAGWAWITPRGTQLNGGSCRPRFHGRGLYRATVWERWRMAREAGSPGLTVQAMPSSRPILARLKFRSVGTWQLYADSSFQN
jgi:hypothetical protein